MGGLARSGFSCLVFALLQSSASAVVVSNFDITNAAWTGGKLQIITTNNGKEALGLTFWMPKGRLESLSLQGKAWKVDLTKFVSDIERPFPLRSQVNIHKMSDDGDVQDFTLTIPFSQSVTECLAVALRVVNGRVVEHSVENSNDVRCEP